MVREVFQRPHERHDVGLLSSEKFVDNGQLLKNCRKALQVIQIIDQGPCAEFLIDTSESAEQDFNPPIALPALSGRIICDKFRLSPSNRAHSLFGDSQTQKKIANPPGAFS